MPPTVRAHHTPRLVPQQDATAPPRPRRGVGARTHGIPARYVSGYLHPSRSSAIGETVQGASHAWVEWWTGDWLGYDPTNDSVVADHHVVVARAREYADVMPVKGIFTGANSELTVTVDVTRVS